MIVLRGLQGFSGGVLIPLAFTIVVSHAAAVEAADRARRLRGDGDLRAGDRPDDRRLAHRELRLAIQSSTSTWCRACVMLAALMYALPKSPMQLGLLRHGDWLGIALMAVGLAAFQTVLDDGNVYDWFGSPFIVKLSLVAAVALGAFIVLELIAPEPLVNLRLLGRRNFGLGTLGQFPARLRALRLGLSAAAISRRVARLRRGADRRGDGLDRAAAAAGHPASCRC